MGMIANLKKDQSHRIVKNALQVMYFVTMPAVRTFLHSFAFHRAGSDSIRVHTFFRLYLKSARGATHLEMCSPLSWLPSSVVAHHDNMLCWRFLRRWLVSCIFPPLKFSQVLERMEHRGGCGCEVNTGDGSGALFAIPDTFYRKECKAAGVDLPAEGRCVPTAACCSSSSSRHTRLACD